MEFPLLKPSRYFLYATLAIILVATAAVLGIGLGERPPEVAIPTPTLTAAPKIASSTPSAVAVPSPVPTAPFSVPTAPSGSITGTFAYPADYIPAVTVYAISTSNPRIWYSAGFAGYGNPPRPTLPPGETQPRYTITGIAPGNYWLVAYRNDGQLPDPGWYSRASDCRRASPGGPCPDNALVPATVTAGQATTGVDIVTWFPPSGGQASPTIPPRP